MILAKQIEIENIFSAEALKALEQLPLKCKVLQEHCITLVELDKRYEKDKRDSSQNV